MDQLKDFLKQCVKYRFWIAVVISLLLPGIGYAVGYGTINAETTKQEAAIKSAQGDIGKFKVPGIVNAQYQPLAATKKEALVEDVDATWRKLFAVQEPLLKWPPEVEERFRKWGRKYPTEVAKNQVQSTLIDYAVAYPSFVSKIYKVFKPFNFEDGTGIVVAPDQKILLGEASYSQDSPPELSKVWAEQERLWVVTALLDVVARVNDSVGAKDWSEAIVKQINLLEVGSPTDQDQKSIAQNVQLVAADVLSPDGTTGAPAPVAATQVTASGPPGMEQMMSGGAMPGMSGGTKTNDVMYFDTKSTKFKSLPIKITVLLDQARLPNFLVGLENSPMAIQVNEVEIAKPLTPVTKPAYGERSQFGMGMMGMMGGRMGGDDGAMVGRPGMMSMPGGGGAGRPGMAQGPGSNYADMMAGQMGGGRGGSGPSASTKKGIDNRTVDAAAERKKREKKEKDAAKAKTDTKKIDQYFNVIEVTVYGQARFYLAPPPPPQPAPSNAAPAPEALANPSPAAAPPAAEPAKKEETTKAEAPSTAPTPAATPANPPTAAPDGAPATPKAETPPPKP
jgi:hypothetical protein